MINLKLHVNNLGKFWMGNPFPHVVLDDFWLPSFAEKLATEVPDDDSELWNGYYNNELEYKRSLNVWDHFDTNTYNAFAFLTSEKFTQYLSNTLDIPGLVPDVGLHGGGLHLYPPGGKLNPHVDYSHHPKTGLRRKLNLLVYLNSDWKHDQGGQLGLWTPDSALECREPEKVIEPLFNRAVIFESTQQSYHGLVHPVSNNGDFRRSMAVYYLIDDNTDMQNPKATFLPTMTQKDNKEVLDLIKRRQTERVNTNINKASLLNIGNSYKDFGVMTDHEKLHNGLYRFGQAPTLFHLARIITDKNSDRKHLLHYDGINVVKPDDKVSKKKYIVATNVAGHPNQWAGKVEGLEKNLPSMDLPELENLFDCIEPEALKDIQAGKAKILLDQTHEGYNARWLWEWFYRSCEQRNIPPEQVLYITGDLLSPDLHETHRAANGIARDRSVTVIGHPLFEEAVYNASLYQWKDDITNFDENLAYKQEHLSEIKTYNLLQKRPRAHRIWLFDQMMEKDLLKHGINTMNYIEDSERGPDGRIYWHPLVKDSESIDRMNTILPMMPEKEYTHYKKEDTDAFSDECSGKWQMMFNREIVLDSWVSIISEAAATENQCFLSEKIFKPLVLENPFMVWGDRFTLKKLQELGYRTFGDFWDESYDEGKDTIQRLDALVNSIQDLCNRSPEDMLTMFKECEEILRHNSALIQRVSTTELREHLKFLSSILN